MKQTLIALALLLLPVIASAQALTNPGNVEFTVSVDHATLTKYVIGYFAVGATSPMMEADLPLGTPDGLQMVTHPINARPLPFGTGYVGKIRAVAGTLSSEWSDASNAFDRIPFPTSAPTVRR